MDVARKGGAGEGRDLLPRPFCRLLDHSPDRKCPGCRRERRRGFGRKDRPIPTHVVLARRQAGVTMAAADESSRRLHFQALFLPPADTIPLVTPPNQAATCALG